MLNAKRELFVDMPHKTVIVGLGKTGMSCAHFLQSRGEAFSVVDNRENPPCLAEFKLAFPQAPIVVGDFDPTILANADRLILSPGVAVTEPAIAETLSRGVNVVGDIELFVQNVNTPIIAITGSNGKSTVTTLLGEMAVQAGLTVKLGGNIGTPALTLLKEQETDNVKPDFYILELSSFQLETTHSLNAFASVILNISPDHMDRYDDLGAYGISKSRILSGSGAIIGNRDDEFVMSLVSKAIKTEGGPEHKRRIVSFGLTEPKSEEFGLRTENSRVYLACGERCLLPVDEMRIAGRHNYVNALAAMALASVMEIPESDVLTAVKNFTGLKHRTQWLALIDGVNWYNDSKGTNVGATVAAINGLPGSKILIAGGEGKGADFTPLSRAVSEGNVRSVVLFGHDAKLIQQQLDSTVPVEQVADLTSAVQRAQQLAQAGSSVLFSPACASFDMFENFEARGDAFIAEVEKIVK